eukprot:TCONS_00006955-protein
MGHRFDSKEINFFRKNILKQYDTSQRSLPWRTIAKECQDENKRAYSVWVSEIMLQQTQVATVIDYYNRWIKKWPTVEDLAEATIEEVNTQWSGLGYYSRGKRLHQGAQEVMNKLNGQIPRTSTALQKKLPGVGPYTAGAIASIAYNEPCGVVDGNVIRVLCRLRTIGANSNSNQVQELLWELAKEVVDPDRPGDFNQALMEFGALTCTPKAPKCGDCPLKDICNAYKMTQAKEKKKKTEDKQIYTCPDIEDAGACCYCLPSSVPWEPSLGVMNYPRKEKKKPPASEQFATIILKQNGKYLLTKRPETGLLAGLWEFPSDQIQPKTTENNSNSETSISEAQLRQKCRDYLKTTFCVEIAAKDLIPCGQVVHVFSHRRHTYHVFKADLKKKDVGINESEKMRWIAKDGFDDIGITTAIRKILALSEGSTQLKGKRPNTGNNDAAKRTLTPNKKQKRMDEFFKKK